MLSPGRALLGANPVMLGSTLNIPLLIVVPARLVTLIFPVVAPAGITALMELAETTLIGIVVLVPLNCTSLAVERSVPEIKMVAPTLPLIGEKELIAGGF